jgi:hypothetical protein
MHACINGNVVLPLVEEFHPFTFGYVVDDQWNCIQKKSLLCCQTKSWKRQPFPGMKKNDITTVSSMLILNLRNSSDRNNRLCRD